MQRYLYVTDPAGTEIPGGRQSADQCETAEQVDALREWLRAIIGEGCSIENNVPDWLKFFADRQSRG
ncbi:hypothetical protein HME9302_02588 [Alteripontixanthobacter maritimus]|uniref:Uncharacterized protein n=1 Tax=Alteripontixanthobacter maritimus TaxID=2161824 RepID=A0A369QDS0_9SPHN|nr:hypothetical protein [Alteripontixanthobacter maritimus]RDC61366.1 hypothetical protein HME9302_02588 [Alteripontixanthobacter maritimus]